MRHRLVDDVQQNDIAMLLGYSSMERDSSLHRDLHFISARLHGVLLRIAFAILPGGSAGGFNKRENVAGKYGMAHCAYISNSVELFMLDIPSDNSLNMYFHT